MPQVINNQRENGGANQPTKAQPDKRGAEAQGPAAEAGEIKFPRIDAREYKPSREVQAFANALAEVERSTAKLLSDSSVALEERVQKAVDANTAALIAAAEKTGIGKFATLGELSNHLREKHQLVIAPILSMDGKEVELRTELVKGKKVELNPVQVENLLRQFSEVTGIKAPPARHVFVQERMLFDAAPGFGISSNHGSAAGLPGQEFSIVLNTEKMKADAPTYKTALEVKQRAVLANELVAAAYGKQYPRMMESANTPFVTLNRQPISPLHILELASDYASLTNGEHIVDAMGRMSTSHPSYLLSNLTAAQALLDVVKPDEKLLTEMAEHFKKAIEAKFDPGPYAAKKLLEGHPELHEKFRKALMARTEETLRATTAVLDIKETMLNR